MMTDREIAQFESWRNYLTGVAYRMLGSVAEAEDVVQDTYLRWRETDRSSVRDVRAYLTTVTSRLCLDRLESAHSKRETYIGPWLPEPLVATTQQPETTEELASDVSFALMLALERLSPLERAAFLLHDVFGLAFDEVAASLERNEAACRQLARRARRQVQAARPRYRVSQREHEQLAERFFTASRNGDIETLRALLTDEAILHTDGGGKRIAALRPIYGADKICRFFAGLARKEALSGAQQWFKQVIVNGLPGWLTVEKDGLPQVITLDIGDNRIHAIYVVRNPEKLRYLAGQLPKDTPVL